MKVSVKYVENDGENKAPSTANVVPLPQGAGLILEENQSNFFHNTAYHWTGPA